MSHAQIEGGAPTAVTTALSGANQKGAAPTLPFGTPAQDSATLSGPNVSHAGGALAYVAYSDSACTTQVATEVVNVTNGSVPASKPFTLLPGTYYWRAFYNGDSQNQQSSSACGSETLSVVANISKAPTCAPEHPRRRFSARQTDLGAIGRHAAETVPAGGHLEVVLPCDLPRRLARKLELSSSNTVVFVNRRTGKQYRFRGLVHYLSPYAFEVTVPGSQPGAAGASALTAARPPRLPIANFSAYILSVLSTKYKLGVLGPVKVTPPPRVTHPTCSGQPPSTFLIYPNHASSPGLTSLLLSCGLKSPVANGFQGVWTPAVIEIYDYQSFQNLTLVNGRLKNLTTFPVRPPIIVKPIPIGPLDVDIRLPSGIPAGVYIPVVRTLPVKASGNVVIEIPPANVLNIP